LICAEFWCILLHIAEGTGLEPATGFPAPHFQSAAQPAKTWAKRPVSGNCQQIASTDTEIDGDLQAVIGAWERLPVAIRMGIVAIVRAMG
jgi:hypothetical protein